MMLITVMRKNERSQKSSKIVIFGGFWTPRKKAKKRCFWHFLGNFDRAHIYKKWPKIQIGKTEGGHSLDPQNGHFWPFLTFFDDFWHFAKSGHFWAIWWWWKMCCSNDDDNVLMMINDAKKCQKSSFLRIDLIRKTSFLTRGVAFREAKIRLVRPSNFGGRALSIVWFRAILAESYMGSIKNPATFWKTASGAGPGQ